MLIKKSNLLFIGILTIILLFSLLSCNKEETQKLIDTSVTTGNLLSQYYDNLIKYTIEAWEMEAFNSSLREIEFPIELQEEYQKTIEHLKARKKMIDSFNRVLPLLEQLNKNKTDEDFKKSLTDLGNNINDLKPLKDSKIILPSEIFGGVASDIINLYKFFEIRSICKTLAGTLEKIKQLYDKESELYESIIEDRNNKSLAVINYMINNEMVVPWALIESAPGTIGLKLAVENKPAKDQQTKKALKKVIDVKYYRMKYLIASSQDELKNLLGDLITAYKDYIQGKKLVFENMGFIINKISEYFTGINQYYEKLKQTNNTSVQNNEIIYHGNKDSKVFHSPSCQYYNSKNSKVIFYSRDEAIEAGYSPCTTCKP